MSVSSLCVKGTILKISILFSLAEPMAISSNCRCIFGPHGTKRSSSLFSNLMTNKQAICSLGREDFIFIKVSSTYQSKRKRVTSVPPLSPFSSFSALHLGNVTPMLTLVFPRWQSLRFFDCLPSSGRQIYFFFFGSELVLEVSRSHRSFRFVCSAIVTETGKSSTPLHT